jgi:two-component system NtrC family response regulator
MNASGMTLYGPLTAQNFLGLLDRLAREKPGRPFFTAVLAAVVQAVGAERGFLLRMRRNGHFRVLASGNFEGELVRAPADCISVFALRRALHSTDGFHLIHDCRVDRRYRTESVLRGRRQARTILSLRVREESGAPVILYLDHRFQPIEFGDGVRTAIQHWLLLLELALRLRSRRAAERSGGGSMGTARAAEAVDDGARAATARRPIPPVSFHGLWTCSPCVAELVETARQVARSEVPVLIHGETGTGKGLLAQALHRASPRAEAPFLSVHCGAIPDALLESELFGHVRGAFTGAERDRVGLVAEAHRGILFLDGISDMSPTMQQKLLRFLEHGKFRPLGGKEESTADVRILSASRLDLEQEMQRGVFRADLYYRLCGVRLRVPPLREHAEDICPLAERFLGRFAAEAGAETPLLQESARERLMRHRWPGNVRELENTMRQLAAVQCREVDGPALAALLREVETAPSAEDAFAEGLAGVVESAEREAIATALRLCGRNKARASRLLGITRKSLYRRLLKYGFLENEGEEQQAAGAAEEGA